jgi:hypothetical protein
MLRAVVLALALLSTSAAVAANPATAIPTEKAARSTVTARPLSKQAQRCGPPGCCVQTRGGCQCEIRDGRVANCTSQ